MGKQELGHTVVFDRLNFRLADDVLGTMAVHFNANGRFRQTGVNRTQTA